MFTNKINLISEDIRCMTNFEGFYISYCNSIKITSVST